MMHSVGHYLIDHFDIYAIVLLVTMLGVILAGCIEFIRFCLSFWRNK